jgi:hypothetical protein
MLARLLVAAFLLGHASIHAGFLSPAPAATVGGPQWPFSLDDSWLLSRLGIGPFVYRPLAFALFALMLGGFALAALAAVGLLPVGIWSATVTIGAVASSALLILFFHPWLVLGVAIDVALLWAVLVAAWAPNGSSLGD